MLRVLAILVLAAGLRPAFAADDPADVLAGMLQEIEDTCRSFNAGAPGMTAEVSAAEIANVLDNVADNQASLFYPSSKLTRATVLQKRYCLDRLLSSSDVPPALHDHLAGVLANLFDPNGPSRRSLDSAPLANAPRSDQPDENPTTAQRPLGSLDVKRFFPWPPALPSAEYIAPMPSNGPQTVAGVYAEVEDKLRKAGYAEQYQFLAQGGFAVVTGVESIESDGKPSAARWPQTLKRLTNLTLASMMRAVFTGEIGHYRIFVIVLTNDASPFRDVPITEELISEWKGEGEPFIPDALLSGPLTPDHHLFYLVYELYSTKESVEFVPKSDLSGVDHLVAAGLLDK